MEVDAAGRSPTDGIATDGLADTEGEKGWNRIIRHISATSDGWYFPSLA